jgi:hypothetical protein
MADGPFLGLRALGAPDLGRLFTGLDIGRPPELGAGRREVVDGEAMN